MISSTNDNDQQRHLSRDDGEADTEEANNQPPAVGSPRPPAAVTAGASGGAPDVTYHTNSQGFGVVGVGASAGGLEAFTMLLDAMPDQPGLAFVLVPHLDPEHRSLMSQLLATHTTMPVDDAHDGVLAAPNRVYVIPPGKFMTIEGGTLHLTAPPDDLASATGRQTAIDTFLRSLALDMQHRAIGIVLSGTSNHGTAGLREIKDRGGLTLVQTPDSARFPQMPQAAIAAGVADRVLAPQDMAQVLMNYAATQRSAGSWLPHPIGETDLDLLITVLAILRAHTKFDFRGYRKNMLLRRVRRRMGLGHVSTLPEYVLKLRNDPGELGRLFHDMLIGVTSFFRDPNAFETLEQRVLEDLVGRADTDRPVRVWVPGCASGEEAYSIAISLIETFTRLHRGVALQLFATDIDESALEIARQGIYPLNIAADISPERVKRFFTQEDGDHYRVKREVRDTVVFAPQNLVCDAPFSRLDLISCRNLLIYLEPEIQRQVISLFHFALHPGGYLLLGPSESIGAQAELFDTLSKEWRLFRRTEARRSGALTFPTAQFSSRERRMRYELDNVGGISQDAGLVAERLLRQEYGPAAVLVSPRFEILYFFGPAADYLELPAGRPTLYLMDLLRDGLRTRVRAACHRAMRDKATVDLNDARVERDGRFSRVHVRVRPLTAPKHMDGMLLISFRSIDSRASDGDASDATAEPGTPEDLALTQQLELELKTTREELQSGIEELESANEELKASNEEAMSANEELQSANEELETSKEELQSLNEELTTVNNQLEEKVQELEHSNNDISNLLASTEIATVFLDTGMRIQRFTPQTAKLLNLRSGDTGRPLADLSPNFRDDDLLSDAGLVLERLMPLEKEITANDGAHYLRRIQPYRTHDNRIEGVVVTFVDVTLRSQAETAIRASEERYRVLFERSPMCLMEQDWSGARQYIEALAADTDAATKANADTDAATNERLAAWVRTHPLQAEGCRERIRISAINRATLDLLGAENAEQVCSSGKRFFPLEPTPTLQTLLGQLLHGRSGVQEFEIRTFDGRRIPVLLHAAPSFGCEQSLQRVLIAVIDISQRKQIEHLLAEREQRLSAILNTVVDGIIGIDRSGTVGEFNAAAQRLFDCPAHRAIGQPLTRFLQPGPPRGDNRDLMQHLIHDATKPPRARLCEGVRTDGTLFPAEMVGAEVDHIGLYVLLVRDISQRRELERQIIETSTHEQERIGQEIHDGLGQQLTAVSLLAKTLAAKLDKTQRPEAAQARQLAQQIEQTLRDSKGITQGLAPVGVAPEQLVEALNALADEVQRSTGVRCVLSGADEDPITDPVITAHLYRIAQEAISNAARHGKPTRIDIRLEHRARMIRLMVRDDGEWADAPKDGPGGLGLHIMGYRAGILGGKLSVSPQPNGGTLMLCEIPLQSD